MNENTVIRTAIVGLAEIIRAYRISVGFVKKVIKQKIKNMKYDQPKSRLIILDYFWAGIILLSICSGVGLILGAESDNVFLNFVSKLSQSASSFNWIDVAAYLGVLFLIWFVRGQIGNISTTGKVVGMLMSALYISSYALRDTDSFAVLYANSYQCFMTMTLLFGLGSLFSLLFEMFGILMGKASVDREDKAITYKQFFLWGMIVIAGWLPWPILNYPGSVSGDGITQLRMYFGGKLNSHHPPLSTWIMGAAVSLGDILYDRRFGVFLYLFFQVILASIIIGYCMAIIYSWGISKSQCVISVCFLSFTPIIGHYAQWFEKDMLYSLFTLLFIMQIADTIRNRNFELKAAIVIYVTGILCCLLRHNGVYAVVPTLIALVFFFGRRIHKIRTGIVLVLLTCSYVMVNSLLFPAMGIESGSIREALSLPMQQSARYIRDHGEEISEKERDVLEGFFSDYEATPVLYESQNADPVKDNVIGDPKAIIEYFQTWFLMGLKHPVTYMEAFGCLNYGYIAPAGQNTEPDFMTKEEVIDQLNGISIDGKQDPNRSELLRSVVRINAMFPIFRYLTMPGTYVWLIMILLAYLIKKRQIDAMILFIPAVMNILVCFAAPLSNAIRYELPIVIASPIYIAWTMERTA